MSTRETEIVQFDNVGLRYGTEREILPKPQTPNPKPQFNNFR